MNIFYSLRKTAILHLQVYIHNTNGCKYVHLFCIHVNMQYKKPKLNVFYLLLG